MWQFIKSFFSFSSPPKLTLSDSHVEFPSDYQNTNPLHQIPDCTNQMTGTDFGNSILTVPANQQREDLIYAQCVSGNLPNWMRQFRPVTVTDTLNNTLTYFVSPDVLCIGTDMDYLRVCLNGYTSRKVADLFGCILPTKLIAQQIWYSADLKLVPKSMGANFNMITTKTMIDHNNIIQQQINGRGFNLLTGHKKDIVITKHLLVDRTRLAIYGWFFPDGTAIQGPTPNSTSHSVNYVDYSSSTRLISKNAFLNGQMINLLDVLNGPSAHLISDEGCFDALSVYL